MSEVRIGDLVICASPALRQELRLARDVGLYLVDRRKDGLVLFGGAARSAWIPKSAPKAVADDDPRVVPPPPWLVRIHRVARRVDAVELELEPDGAGGFEVRVGCRELDPRTWADLHDLLGPVAERVRVRPAGMSRLHLVFPSGEPSG